MSNCGTDLYAEIYHHTTWLEYSEPDGFSLTVIFDDSNSATTDA